MIASMTGYARADDAADGLRWTWELRSVNAKGLDVRARLASGYEALDVDVKPLVAQYVTRGAVNVTLVVAADAGTHLPAVNEALLAHYANWALELHSRFGLPLPSGAELLALRGALDTPPERTSDEDAARCRKLLPSLDAAAAGLARARREEGARLAAILSELIDAIARALDQARIAAAAQPQRLAERLTATLEDLLVGDRRVDPDRLAQEVALLAAKADVREELDRLGAHIAAARELLAAQGPVGRKFDFLAQEFNREANTLCSKAATPALTSLGLELKTLIDQLREQVQNVE